jgi:hypothetical protein
LSAQVTAQANVPASAQASDAEEPGLNYGDDVYRGITFGSLLDLLDPAPPRERSVSLRRNF